MGAAVIIPIVAAGMPLIMQIARPLVQLAEGLFGNGAGASKAKTVLDGLLSFLTPLATSGILQQPVPSPADLATIIEAVLAELKLTGQLPTPGSGVPQLTVTPAAPAQPASAILQGMQTARAVLDSLIQSVK